LYRLGYEGLTVKSASWLFFLKILLLDLISETIEL
jgi:hypothetical protein